MRVLLPKDWSQVTVYQFQELTKAKERCEDEIDMIIEIISILSEKTRQDISTIEMKDLFKMWDALKFINETEIPDKLEKRIRINGINYYSDLDILKFTTGQYADLKSYLKDKDIVGNLHNILSVFYIPVGEKYCKGRDINKIKDDFLDCPISIAYPIAVFFWNLLNGWMKIIEDYSQEETLKRIASLKL